MTGWMSMLAGTLLAAFAGGTGTLPTAAPMVTTHVNGSVGLIAFDKREFRRTPLKGRHLVVSLSSLGDVIGVVLDKKGRTRCELVGYFDGDCVILSGCGASGVSCL